MLTIRLIGARGAIARSLLWSTLLTVLGTMGGFVFLVAFFLVAKPIGDAGFALMPAVIAALYALALAAAVALVATFASRLLTIGLPLALIALPVLLLVLWSGDHSQIQVFRPEWPPLISLRTLQIVASAPTLTILGMCLGAGLMRTMRDWRRNAGAVAYVALAVLAALPALAYALTSLGSLDWPRWPMLANAYLPIPLTSRLTGVPAASLHLAAFTAAGLWQRRGAKGKPRMFGSYPIGWALGIALLASAIISLPSVAGSTDGGYPYLVAAGIPITLVKGGWLYWLPVFAALMTWRTWPASRIQGGALTAAALAPFALWGLAALPHALAETVDYAGQRPIQWDLNDRKYAVLLPTPPGRDAARALRDKGYADEPWTQNWADPKGQGSYWRAGTKETFPGGDSIEIRSSPKGAEGVRTIPGTGAYYAYVNEDGRSRFVGAMRYQLSGPYAAPSFPPRIIGTSFAREREDGRGQVRYEPGGRPDQVLGRMLSLLPAS